MQGFKAAIAVFLAIAVGGLMLRGCGGASLGSDANDDANPTPRQQDCGFSNADEPTLIREYDFSKATWTDVDRNMSVHLEDGTSNVGGTTYRTNPAPVFGDVDGDGFDDALVTLTRLEKDEDGVVRRERAFYVWRWMQEPCEPMQVAQVVARTDRCNWVRDVDATDEGFRIRESRFRHQDSARCRRAEPARLTRTVVVDDANQLVQVAPTRGYGGICPEVDITAAHLEPPAPLRVAPDPDAEGLHDTSDVYRTGAEIAERAGTRSVAVFGWQLVSFRESGFPWNRSFFPGCAWMPRG